MLLGGGQEDGRRSGTQNVCRRRGLRRRRPRGRAGRGSEESARLRALRDRLYAGLAPSTAPWRPRWTWRPGSDEFLPNIVHVLVDGLESQTLILRFDALGVRGFGRVGLLVASTWGRATCCRRSASTGDRAHGALRVSMGRLTTERDVVAFAEAMDTVLNWK